MAEKISFTCAIEESDDEIENRIAQTIKSNEGKFWRYFARLINTEDARYTVIDDSLEIEEVVIAGAGGCAYGNFTWDFYAGCKDINSTDEKEVEINFQISGENIVFDIELPVIWRSDED